MSLLFALGGYSLYVTGCTFYWFDVVAASSGSSSFTRNNQPRASMGCNGGSLFLPRSCGGKNCVRL